ncbi:MAG: response regulator transcription factor [Dehalococcoidales bacterium]|nr:MAG: response regulator transcription factor [Dehalococcoidales bacterium]
MPSRKTAVMVVDDDIRILRMMRRMLELEGYRVITSPDGQTAIEIMEHDTPDLLLLDIMLPGMEGHTVCRRIREFSQVPIIMVTAKGADEEKVKGLDAGADDYVTKPFSASELTARVRAVLRRASLSDEPTEPTFRYQNLEIDFFRRRVTLDGEDVNLTGTEYKVLSYLTRNVDRVVTPNQILNRVWGDEYLNETNLIQANIARLRKKLKDNARNSRFIFTKPGIGYMFARKNNDEPPS